MRIFISAGEPSGDLHGASLIRALRQVDPGIEWAGFGGDRIEAAGCRLLFPLTRLAVIGFSRALAYAPMFLQQISRADRYFRHQRPDAVVLVDFPGFNWWVARRAHYHGIPVFYFVPPQLWAWLGGRVRKMRRWVDHVLCTLPFELTWYRERGVDAHYVGHPYFDELGRQHLDDAFLSEQRAIPGVVIGLLPGSRNMEVERNLPTLVRSAALIHAQRPDTRFLVACFKHSQQQTVDQYVRETDLPIATFTGKTPEIIHLSHSCVAVSGSVGLELLYHGKPSVVVYRVTPMFRRIVEPLLTTQYISLVNLLAERRLFPEYPSERCEAEAVSTDIVRWLNEPTIHASLVQELGGLRQRVAEPGACLRAAQYIHNELATVAHPSRRVLYKVSA